MLKIVLPTLMLFPTIWLVNKKWLWVTPTIHSLIIATISLKLFSGSLTTSGWSALSSYLASDSLSTPLIVLTCWLLPLTMIASSNHVGKEPINQQRIYLSLLVSLQLFLVLAFGATEILLFYIMFEASLIPTLFLITRWGNQVERLNAGTYLLFYTLAGSLPLLMAVLMAQAEMGSLSLLTMDFSGLLSFSHWGTKVWWIACLAAFMIKAPIYGAHLWLPKAHVEAPVAGSMVLAAVLLKLGGYGMMRMALLLEPYSTGMAYPYIVLSLWGIFMTGTICLRQTDMKALIAYASVSHMGLVLAAILIQTPWSFDGALTLMLAHGLTSSALFCLNNINYERTHTRTMALIRGLQALFPLLSVWWFLASLANFALPPLPSSFAELFMMISLFGWSPYTILLTGAGVLLTVIYSLYLFLMTQRGAFLRDLLGFKLPPSSREDLLILLHLVPLIHLAANPMLFSGGL
uniref:NADH-ubiquinone oxidoreductase chain 4 n=1 Tax=Gigantura chuni TaxID=172116 RepID=A0A0E4B873_9TELE|nr:NADH dehydrogenase subunit 4 [Gigantura chuni]